jgi:hypothetical protein
MVKCTRFKHSVVFSVVMHILSEKTRRFGGTYLPLPLASIGLLPGLIAEPPTRKLCVPKRRSPLTVMGSNPEGGTHSYLPWSESQIQATN